MLPSKKQRKQQEQAYLHMGLFCQYCKVSQLTFRNKLRWYFAQHCRLGKLMIGSQFCPWHISNVWQMAHPMRCSCNIKLDIEGRCNKRKSTLGLGSMNKLRGKEKITVSLNSKRCKKMCSLDLSIFSKEIVLPKHRTYNCAILLQLICISETINSGNLQS